ncbi:TRAP transporter large permease [Photobacterium minamisatsumaniensis]|uniref:TRAP transporter large permease n=1 Tax=Photobacterium minamisatsumaniensis TaxID=2910233 RepID=UPI003D0F06E2
MIYTMGLAIGLIVLLFIGLHVASAISVLAFTADFFLLDSRMMASAASIAWDRMNEFSLIAIPLFVLLGEILLRSGIANRLYTALAAWLERLPGGLLHTNTVASSLFAAMSGSSVATAATIGTVAIPILEERGYNKHMVLGSLAAGGTLGVLIPPSILMIVYGALADVSVGKLFVAAVIPGLILTLLMSAIIITVTLFLGADYKKAESMSLKKKVKLLLDILPVTSIFIVILGSIYFGFATPTEAAALGIVAALGLTLYEKKLSVSMLHNAFHGTFKTTSMIILIIASAFCLNFVLSLLGIPQAASQAIMEAGLSPYTMIWMLVIFYIILGCFLEAVSMMVTTVGIVVPIAVAAGFDSLWFGIFLTVLMELSLITPPVGLNLYVVQNLRKGQTDISDVFVGVIPFVMAFFILIAILIYYPQVALWLPSMMK